MTHLDGNALAGQLAELLGGDPTSMIAECDSCGTGSMLGELIVWLDPDGVRIARCPHCTAVMLALRSGAIDVRGVRTLRTDDVDG